MSLRDWLRVSEMPPPPPIPLHVEHVARDRVIVSGNGTDLVVTKHEDGLRIVALRYDEERPVVFEEQPCWPAPAIKVTWAPEGAIPTNPLWTGKSADGVNWETSEHNTGTRQGDAD